jgi:hypothetical protein
MERLLGAYAEIFEHTGTVDADQLARVKRASVAGEA